MKRHETRGSFSQIIVPAIITILVALGIKYLFHPALTLRSGEFWGYLLGCIVVGAISFGISSWIAEEIDDGSIAWIGFIGCLILLAVWLISWVIGLFCSGSWTNASKYQKLIQIDNGYFAEDFKDISDPNSEETIAMVDLQTAKMLGARTIGNIDHASWYEVDKEFNLIKYDGGYYRISPLNYGGMFKYNKAKDSGLPGFVLVNVQTGKAEFVEIEGGYFYSPSAYFGKNLYRHLREQYSSAQLGKAFFEVDESGNPYWITAVKESQVGFWGGKYEGSVIITNAVTGDSQKYSLDEVPAWVDHSVDLDYIMTTIQYHYSYVGGFWNSVGSKTGVYNLSYAYRDNKFSGYNSIIGSDGEIYFYSGLTPANNAESNAGFILVNTRTGKVKQYDYENSNAAEESSAQSAAESLVQNFGYEATFPIVVNVAGEPTYLMSLKDKAGLVQRYALCNVENYAIVVESDSYEGVIERYIQKLNENGVSVEGSEDAIISTSTVRGNIDKFYSANIDGTTYFYYKLTNNDAIFKASIKVNELQITLEEGQRVKIEYVETEEFGEVVNIEF